MIKCEECRSIIESYLCDIPYKWRNEIAEAICLSIFQELDCESVKKCQSHTFLHEFKQVNNKVSISYTDELGNIKTSYFDINTLIPQITSSPGCITTQQIWDSLSHDEKLQYILDYECGCCRSEGNSLCYIYKIFNEGNSPVRVGFTSCDGSSGDLLLAVGVDIYVCARYNSISEATNVTIIQENPC